MRREPNDAIDFPGGQRSVPWCKCLSFVVLTAILTPTIWYIHATFCSTQIFFNRVEQDLYKIREEIERMKSNIETSNQQLEPVGKDCGQRLTEVKEKLKKFKTCSNSESSEVEDCCVSFDLEEDEEEEEPIGRADFALESSGGSIIDIGDTEQFGPASSVWLFGIPICCSRNGPRAVIQANVQPGECWAFKGDSGTVTIRLLGRVLISGVTLEHIPKRISPSGNINSAPCDFSVLGLTCDRDKEGTLLGQFSYSAGGSPVQFFEIDGCSQSYEVIKLQIHSNHGNPHFTCVYRLQVHGKLDEDGTEKLDGQ